MGVDATGDRTRKLGQWERHHFGERTVWFMPVVRLDPAGGRQRVVPDALRLAVGTQRYRRRLPSATRAQAHRMDLGLYIEAVLRQPLSYFIHSQSGGIGSAHSDSIWRHASSLHETLERRVAARAESVIVFNPEYAATVSGWNHNTLGSPTWYDPDVFRPGPERDTHHIVWAGRLEPPKDPILALQTFEQLVMRDPAPPWTLTMVGAGTLEGKVRDARAALPDSISSRITVTGGLPPNELAGIMGSGGTFLMTSHPGYEGFSMTLVESMASGLVPIVTEGSDTGGLVSADVGSICSRDPSALADALLGASRKDRQLVCERVNKLRADIIVSQVLAAAGS
ncbi:MAG TPA: glycosyltransferase [Mycobacteriales bacterium]|nr:glycosyltransferase [Mycobacteriales bacterium]